MRWLLLLLLARFAPAHAETGAAGHAWLAAGVARFNEDRLTASPEAQARAFVEGVVDLDAFARATLRDYVDRSLAEFEGHLGAEEMRQYADRARQRLRGALGRRLAADLAGHLAPGDVGPLDLVASDFGPERGSGQLRAAGPGPDAGSPPLHIVCHARRANGVWRLEDLEVNGRLLSLWYRERYADSLHQQYSPSVLEAQLEGRDYVVLEDLADSPVDGMPIGWRWRERDEKRRKPYAVQERDGHRYLAARDRGESVILLKFSHWNPRQYPIMTWCWRADVLPAGGDERYGHTNDSAAGIYVVFSQNWLGLPWQIKYVWSTMLPENTIDRRDRVARPWFVVVESGAARLGQWTFESVDLERDFERTYGGRPKERTQGLGLLTDANSTGSYAEAYYADLRAWTRTAYEEGRVQDYCGCYRQLGAITGPPAGAADTGSAATTSGTTP